MLEWIVDLYVTVLLEYSTVALGRHSIIPEEAEAIAVISLIFEGFVVLIGGIFLVGTHTHYNTRVVLVATLIYVPLNFLVLVTYTWVLINIAGASIGFWIGGVIGLVMFATRGVLGILGYVEDQIRYRSMVADTMSEWTRTYDKKRKI